MPCDRTRESAVRYADAGQEVITSGRARVPYYLEGALGIAAHFRQRPARTMYRPVPRLPARGRDTHGSIVPSLISTALGLISSALHSTRG